MCNILTNEAIELEKRKIQLHRKIEWISTFRRDIFCQWRFTFKMRDDRQMKRREAWNNKLSVIYYFQHLKYYMDVISKKGMSVKTLKEEQIFPQLDKDQIPYTADRFV